MKTRIGNFQLSLIFTSLIVLFALLMMWPNKASSFPRCAETGCRKTLSASTISEKVMALGDHHALPDLWNNSFNGS